MRAVSSSASSRPQHTMTSPVTVRSDRVRPPRASPSATAGRVRVRRWVAVLKGMTSRPSATSAASATIWGPRPPRAIGRWAVGVGSRVEQRRHQGVRGELAPEVEPLAGLPGGEDGPQRTDQLAHPGDRAGRTTPRSASPPGPGSGCRDPRVNRPFDSSWRSQAWWASCTGLRGKAMATLVASSSVDDAPAARISGVKTSWGPSKVNAPSTPRASRRRAWSAASSRPASWVSNRTGPCSHRPGGAAAGPRTRGGRGQDQGPSP